MCPDWDDLGILRKIFFIRNVSIENSFNLSVYVANVSMKSDVL